MLYKELKEISTNRLLNKLIDYSESAIKNLNEGQIEIAKSLLEDIIFYLDYHSNVTLNGGDDDLKKELQNHWDKINGV